MNTYAMVERIIELAEKGKIRWFSEFCGVYKNITIELNMLFHRRELFIIKVNMVKVVMTKEQNRRLRKAIDRYVQAKESKKEEGILREASDILEIK